MLKYVADMLLPLLRYDGPSEFPQAKRGPEMSKQLHMRRRQPSEQIREYQGPGSNVGEGNSRKQSEL